MVKKLEFTSNDRSRRTKFKNRTNSLKKKIEELSILCGIDVGAIIFANDADAQHHHGKQQLIVWDGAGAGAGAGPQPHIKIQELLSSYKEKAAEANDAADNSGDTSSTASSHSQDSKRDELGTSWYDALSLQHLNEVVQIVDRRIAAVDNKIQFLRKSQGMPPLPEASQRHCHAVHCCCRGYDVVDPGCSHLRDLNITLHGTCSCCVDRH